MNHIMERRTWGAIGLVAGRELSVRLRSKAIIIGTVLMVVVIIALPLVIKLIGNSVGDQTIGVTGNTVGLTAAVEASGNAVGQDITVVTEPDQASGEQQVSAGKLDGLLIANPKGELTLVVKKSANSNLTNALNVLAQQATFSQQITALGGDPAQVRTALNNAHVAVQPLEKPYSYQVQQLILGIVAGVLIYTALMISGQLVAQGVVEEKSSRVVELLLSTVRPWELMLGKVLGIGTIGLAQVVLVGVAGVTTGLLTHTLTISLSAAAGTLIWLIVWFLLGYLMFAIVFAGLGALVSRQEEVASAIMPALMFLIVGYIVGVSVLPSDPSSRFVEILSIIPLFAPTVMPMRLSMGGVPGWEAYLSAVLVAALIPVLLWLAGRIYRNAVLRSGARVRLAEALRPA